jgi:hypothetical protein
MKVTFELPPTIVQRLRFYVPSGERSRFVADLISRKPQKQGNALECAAQNANILRKVNRRTLTVLDSLQPTVGPLTRSNRSPSKNDSAPYGA